jgi:hypothetical protein
MTRISHSRTLPFVAAAVALSWFASSSGAEARCVWYGPGSTGAARCAPAGYQPSTYVPPRPAPPVNQIGRVTYSPNAVRIPAGVMHRRCRQVAWGIDCR